MVGAYFNYLLARDAFDAGPESQSVKQFCAVLVAGTWPVFTVWGWLNRK